VREAQLRLYQEASSAAGSNRHVSTRIERMDQSQTGVSEAVLWAARNRRKLRSLPLRGSRRGATHGWNF